MKDTEIQDMGLAFLLIIHGNDIVFGNNLGELMISSDGEDNEGLFYVLYAMEGQNGVSIGTKIGSGTVEWNAIEEEIQEYESQKVNETK